MPGRAGSSSPAGQGGSATCWCWPNEAPVAAFRAEAWIKAGEALRRAERFEFALEHLDRGLEIEPQNLKGLREKGICLQRLALAGAPGHSLDRAREHYRAVLEIYPNDSGDLGAARARRQGCLDRGLAPGGPDAGADARRRRVRGCAAARGDRQLRQGYPRQPRPLLLRHQRADPDAPLPPPDRRHAL